MNVTKKIILIIVAWLVVTAAVFLYVLPKVGDSLIALQNSHQDQINQLSLLQAQTKNLTQMQADLDVINKKSIKPDDLFPIDVSLVNQLKFIENIAQQTNNQLTIQITGSENQATPVSGSLSHLLQSPYSIKIVGTFPDAVNFIQQMETSYFISPIAGINMSEATDTKLLTTQILTNAYLRKNAN